MLTDSDLRQLKLLIWLKMRLTFLSMRRNKARVINLVVFTVAFLPLSVGAAFGINTFLSLTNDRYHIFIVRDVLALIFSFWILAPIAGIQLSETFDITKLFAYPVKCRTIFASTVINSLFDTTFLLAVPTFLVLALHGPANLIWLRVVLLGLFAVQTIALSQALILTQFGFLKSRKFKDMATVLIPLMGMAYIFLQQTFLRQLGRAPGIEVLDAPIWHAANYLAPGWTATGIGAAEVGNWLMPLKATVLLLIVSYAAFALANRSITSLYFGDAVIGVPETRAAKTERSYSFSLPAIIKLPPDISAVMKKELIYLQREPVYKALALQAVYMMVIIALPLMTPGGPHFGTTLNQSMHLGTVALATTFAIIPIVFNCFGSEGAAVTVLFSMPSRRRSFILGKNIVHAALLLAVPSLTMLAVTLFTHSPANLLFSAVVVVWICVPVVLAVGNASSVFLPYSGLARAQRFAKPGSTNQSAGCLTGLLRLVSFIACLILSLPVALGIMLPLWFTRPEWLLLSVPLCLIYAAVIYLVSLTQSEHWLIDHEPEIIAKILPRES